GGEGGAGRKVQGVGEVFVDEAEDPGGRDAVGQERAHARAGAAAHVDVEVRVAVQAIFQGRDGTDLVHPADDAAAGEGEGVTVLAPRVPKVLRALEGVQKIPQGPTQRRVVVDDRNDPPVPLTHRIRRSSPSRLLGFHGTEPGGGDLPDVRRVRAVTSLEATAAPYVASSRCREPCPTPGAGPTIVAMAGEQAW